MTNPIKNNQVPPQDPYSNSYGKGGPDPYAKNQGTGGSAPDPYGEYGYDPGMGGDEYGMDGGYEDEFVGGDIDGGDEMGGAPAGGYSVADLREMVTSMKGTLSAEQYASFMGRINASAGMSPEKQEAELAKIANELNMIANPQAGMEGMEGEEGVASNEAIQKQADDFKKELKSYRNDVEGMENLTEDEKTEFLGAIDKMINDIELAEKDPARLAELDIESMKGELKDLQSGEEGVDAANQHPQSVKSLAEAAGMTPEELAAKAEAKGVDLSNVPVPPTMEIFEFLKEISPELKQKIEAVAAAVSERTKFADDALRAANKQNSDNDSNDTSAPDNTSPDNWQHLLDLNYYQDDKSKAVKEAMLAVSTALKPLLESMYPGQDVKLVETTGKSGWEKDQQDFLNADKISIGGTVIDLFGAKDGMIHSSTTADQPDKIEYPTILYDGSGTSAWKPAKSWFNLYGESELKIQYTDDNEMGGNTMA